MPWIGNSAGCFQASGKTPENPSRSCWTTGPRREPADREPTDLQRDMTGPGLADVLDHLRNGDPAGGECLRGRGEPCAFLVLESGVEDERERCLAVERAAGNDQMRERQGEGTSTASAVASSARRAARAAVVGGRSTSWLPG